MANPYYICAYGHVMRISVRVTSEHTASLDTFGIGMGGSERNRVTVIRCDGKGWNYLTNERKEELRRQLAIKHKRLTGEVMGGYETLVKDVNGPKERESAKSVLPVDLELPTVVRGLRVESVKADGETLYGVTDGGKWFAYAYTTKEAAEELLACLGTALEREVNVGYSQPFIKSDATASEIRENRLKDKS